MIGVTIGGIYMYVGQSRVNTDENNANSVTSTLSTMAADQDVYNLASDDAGTEELTTEFGSGVKGTKYEVKWKTDKKAVKTDEPAIDNYCKSVLTNGLPGSKTGNGFILTIALTKADANGTPNVYVNCVAQTSSIGDTETFVE